jgi:hypothetical protein
MSEIDKPTTLGAAVSAVASKQASTSPNSATSRAQSYTLWSIPTGLRPWVACLCCKGDECNFDSDPTSGAASEGYLIKVMDRDDELEPTAVTDATTATQASKEFGGASYGFSEPPRAKL